jgi:hypothetical protein
MTVQYGFEYFTDEEIKGILKEAFRFQKKSHHHGPECFYPLFIALGIGI